MSNTNHTFHATALAAVNEALVTLGQDVVLAAGELSTSSAAVNGRKAAFVYNSSRLRVLRDHGWNFARREYLTGQTACSPNFDAYPFRVPVPPKCVRLIACFTCARRIVHHQLFGSEVRADEPIERIVYTSDVEDLDKWSPDAYHALVLRLAADLAKPITGRTNERQLQEQAYADVIADAKLHDACDTNTEYDAYGSNHYVEAMRGVRGGFRRPDDCLRR